MKNITLTLAVLLTSLTVFCQTEKEKVLNTVNKSTIEAHVYFLADDLLKGRETGTPENKIAASYLANTLRSYSVKPNPKTGTYFQSVPLLKTFAPKISVLQIDGSDIKNKVAVRNKGINHSGEGVYLGYGLESDYAKTDVKGKAVILKAGSPDSKDARAAFRMIDKKVELAQKAGAIAIIEMLPAADEMWEFIDHNFNTERLQMASEENKNSSMPYIWVQDPNNTLAAKIAASEKHNITLSVENEIQQTIESQNVIGIVEGTDSNLKNEYIIYSGHYDHVGIGTPDKTGDTIYNGARDNAVGTTTVLSMAENLAKYPTKRSALFILFTGEEKGLLGSNYYVEHPVLPLEQMVFCFNSDNAGYNDTSISTIVGLERTTAHKNIKDAVAAFGLTATDDPAPEQGLFDRSDNVHFAKKGIPAPTFSLGFTAFNGDVTKYYHRPGDEADSLDYDYLLKFFQGYVLAGRLIGNDAKTPVWTKGDTYEAAAQKLYRN